MIKLLHEDGKQNKLSLSDFRDFEGSTHFNQVAAKFVVKGEETYIIKGRQYVVQKGAYIIGNSGVLSEVSMTQHTIGLCIDISNDMIAEVMAQYYEQSDILNFIIGDDFLINTYRSEHTTLGIKLQALSEHLLRPKLSPPSSVLSEELFLSLAESVIFDQAKVFGELSKLTFKKQIVNEENYKKLLSAKTYIDDCFLDGIGIEALVQMACMSKYNFIRLFKHTFGISPYQYILAKRLLYAKQALLRGQSASEVADLAGFADVAAFSKAFKAHFSVSPNRIAG